MNAITKLDDLVAMAQKKGTKKTIAVAAADDDHVLYSVKEARYTEIAVAIVVCNSDNIKKIA